MQSTNYLNRLFEPQIEQSLFQGRAIIVVGARQVGKTTLCEKLLDTLTQQGKRVLRFNGDYPSDRMTLHDIEPARIAGIVENVDVLFIDEAQLIPNIGTSIKVLVDYYKGTKQVIATSSSSINLLDLTSEALTGRKDVFHLNGLSYEELALDRGPLELNRSLEALLMYGTYPGVVVESDFAQKEKRLRDISGSALYKDILEFQTVKNPQVLRNLLQALALQIGNEVSYNELANLLQIDRGTVERYVDLLEKNYIIFRLAPYFTNKRKELSRMRKIYFRDVGVRNALINNFNPLQIRSDVGQLWENAMIVERMKRNEHRGMHPLPYFWRNRLHAEVDLVEEMDGILAGFEFKWGTKHTPRPPKAWSAYANSSFEIVHPNQYLSFVGIT